MFLIVTYEISLNNKINFMMNNKKVTKSSNRSSSTSNPTKPLKEVKATKAKMDDMDSFISSELAKFKMNKGNPMPLNLKQEEPVSTKNEDLRAANDANILRKSFQSSIGGMNNQIKTNESFSTSKGEDMFKNTQTKFGFKVNTKMNEIKQSDEANQFNVSSSDMKIQPKAVPFTIQQKFVDAGPTQNIKELSNISNKGENVKLLLIALE